MFTQIAHVTLWTDYSFPVIDFNIYLTGYDVQSINLYDVIALGTDRADDGTGYEDIGPPGRRSRRRTTRCSRETLTARCRCSCDGVHCPYAVRRSPRQRSGARRCPRLQPTSAASTPTPSVTPPIDVASVCGPLSRRDADYFTPAVRRCLTTS